MHQIFTMVSTRECPYILVYSPGRPAMATKSGFRTISTIESQDNSIFEYFIGEGEFVQVNYSLLCYNLMTLGDVLFEGTIGIIEQ